MEVHTLTLPNYLNVVGITRHFTVISSPLNFAFKWYHAFYLEHTFLSTILCCEQMKTCARGKKEPITDLRVYCLSYAVVLIFKVIGTKFPC